MDTQKRELIGWFKNAGTIWCRDPHRVNIYDFRSLAEGIAIPYGVYDSQRNAGFVYVGAIGLAAFAVVELFIAKEPLLDLRLFAKRIFLNASVLVINTWQLSQLKADTSIGWIVFLLALRGVALGSTVQTTLVTALSVVPLRQLAVGSSLINATRQVVQAIGVALLATVLASTLSPQVAALEQQFLDLPQHVGAPPVGVCNMPTAISGPASDPAMTPSPQLIDRACQETVAGFEQAYKVTFFASIAAVVLGLMLPGWPGKWAGRRAADAPTAIGH